MTARMVVVGLMFLLSSWAVRAVGHGTPVDLRRPFSEFPDRLATWQGEDQRFTPRIEEKLGVTDYVSKFYRDNSGKFIHVYVGYYASQQHGETIHSPKNCLPGNGWYIAKKERATVDAPRTTLSRLTALPLRTASIDKSSSTGINKPGGASSQTSISVASISSSIR